MINAIKNIYFHKNLKIQKFILYHLVNGTASAIAETGVRPEKLL